MKIIENVFDSEVIKAWVAYNYKANTGDISLLFATGREDTLLVFKHPRGVVYIDNAVIHADFTETLKKAGYFTSKYLSFASGFSGHEKPNRSHPILRHYYRAGLEARTNQATAA